MSKGKYCPECGEAIGVDERFCPNCGMELPVEVEEKDIPVVGAGARANIMGGINKTTTTHNNVNTSNVDNSSIVNHNTTYVMNEKKKEFCEVCGNPLEEKHARCPKCGKEICLDCKVKGKNRCVECEKKAMNDYRIAFQQFIMTSGGTIGAAGRQILNQKAGELDVGDVQSKIEEKLLDEYKPTVKSVQPEVVPIATMAETASQTMGMKGVGTSEGRKAMRTSHGNNVVWIIIVAILVAIIAAFVLLNGDKEKEATSVSEKQVQEEQIVQPTITVPSKTKTSQTVVPVEKPVVVEESVTQPVVEKPDANYDAGMKAYEAGNGLDAISAFKKSGSAKSYYMLGLIYENGCGNVGKNAMMARKNFKTAAQMGSEEAKAKL